jgi:4-amino-4-deoxy-L-arabinose transferase-like glycosyltransferase
MNAWSKNERGFAALTLILLLAIAAGWKTFLLARGAVPFNADEAVVALMARHILQGARPVFFYGQAYMGSLDAYLVAGGFALFGENVWVVRLVQILLYLGTLATTYLLGKAAFGRARSGLAAVLLLAIPSVNVTLYTTASLGGYGEALLIGNLLLILALRMSKRPGLGGIALWGWLAGLGLWADGLTLVYTLPALFLMGWQLRQEKPRRLFGFAAAMVAGGLVGALPWWLYALQTGFDRLVLELLGSAVAVEQTGWLARTGMHLVNLLLLGLPAALSLRPPWSVEWLALPLLPAALLLWGAVIWFWFKRSAEPSAERPTYRLLAGVGGVLAVGFLFTSFGVDPSGRYFLPLAVPLALAAGELAWSLPRIHPRLAGAGPRGVFLGVLLAFQLWGNLQTGLRYPPGLTTQFDRQTIVEMREMSDLAAFLRENGETRGYTTYWVAYPLAFLSAEELIFTPRLPYHADLRYTARDDRYPPYDLLVAESERTAYIAPRGAQLLDEHLTTGLNALGVTYATRTIGDFKVYYDLSSPVRPEQLGLGVDQP